MKLDLSRKKILIVDDFPDMRSTLKRMLQTFNARDIDVAANGRDALSSMGRKSYDLVLCDYNLGSGKDGQQVLEEAKHKGLIGYSSIFFIITAENTMEMVMGAMEYRPDDYLTKPFNKELLGTRLEKQMIRKADLAEIERASQRHEFQHAIELCDQRMASNPRNITELLRIKGELSIDAGDYDGATHVYERVLAARSVPWALLGMGKVHYLRGQLLDARNLFEELVREHRTYMEAYDWLAKCFVALGEPQEAQRVLGNAIELSPKAILRQKALGEVALKNHDLHVAEEAFRKTVRLGKESIYRSPTDYTRLVQSMGDNNQQEALKLLATMRKEFDNDREAVLRSSIAESAVLRSMGRESEAYRAYEEASKQFEGIGDKAPTDLAMEMARACFQQGEGEKGMALMQDVVRNHHEDEGLLNEVQQMFDQVGMSEEGQAAISDAKAEVVALNNQGVKLVREGQLEEAISFFENAVKGMANNKTVNLNAAQVMLMSMQRSGRNDRYLYQVRQYLDRVRMLDPGNATCIKLSGIYEKMVAEGL